MHFIYNIIDLFKIIIEDNLNIIKPEPVKCLDNKTPPYAGNDQFIQWFVGFSDAESFFLINTKNESEVHFTFQITLHIDDLGVLYTIIDRLGIGVVSSKGNTCSYRISAFQVIVENLLPIFDSYSLLTHKQLDYRDWKKAIMLKKLGQEKGRSLNNDTYLKILDIKNNINRSRNNFDDYVLCDNMINKNWLIGFIEGDGTFYFSNSSVVFGITQKDKEILEKIAYFIEHNVPLSPPYYNLCVPNKPNCIIKNNTNAYQLVITDKDVLFQYIYPFFRSLPFYSRKGIDFAIWGLVLYIFMYGYHNLPLGEILLLKLSNSMNSKRYFSNLIDFIDLDKIKNIFNVEPPFDIHSGKSHFYLAKEYSLAKGSRKGFKVYIYKNGIEIKGSPFNSFRSGSKALGINSTSSIRNYLDTGKIFKDGYTFYTSSKLK